MAAMRSGSISENKIGLLILRYCDFEICNNAAPKEISKSRNQPSQNKKSRECPGIFQLGVILFQPSYGKRI